MAPARYSMSGLYSILNRFPGSHVLVIGDIILDHFLWGQASRISPEAPVPVVNVREEEYLLGGAANVLRNIISLGGTGELCGIIGEDSMGKKVSSLLEALGDSGLGLIKSERPTTLKTRVLAHGQQIVRIDREEAGPLAHPSQNLLDDFLKKNIDRFEAVVVSDYAKGIVNETTMQTLRHSLTKARSDTGKPLPLIVDPKPTNHHLFVGATVVTPNHHEARQIASLPAIDESNLLVAARTIQEELACSAVLITRGEAGMALWEGEGPLALIPTMAKEVFDVTGAGDTVAATISLALACGASMLEAATLANHAAGIVVGKVGTASVSRRELGQALGRTKI